MSLNRRKKATDPLEIDAEEIEPLVLNDNPSNNIDEDSYVTWRTNKILFIIVIILFTIILSSPAETKRLRKERNDKQLEALSESIKRQKAALLQKYNEIKSAISSETDNLDVISKDYHEEKIKALESDHQEEITKIQKDHEDQINKLKESHDMKAEQLLADLSEKEKKIDELNADIEKHKKELMSVKSKLDGFQDEAKEFCSECSYDVGGLRTSCGLRLAFLLRKYGSVDDKTEDDYKDAIIEVEPNCIQKAP